MDESDQRAITTAMLARHEKAAKDGGSIYDDGDPTGDRVITLALSDGRTARMYGARPTYCEPADDMQGVLITIAYDRIEFFGTRRQ